MPQVDLETLVTACAGGGYDRKIACETQADDDDPPKTEAVPDDFPPESFWLSKDAEYDWFDRNAFYERNESTRGNSNSTQPVNPNSNAASQRFSISLKSKASMNMIGLPHKPTSIEKRRACTKPANIRLFPKRSESSIGKPAAPVAEPGSPKVSCMGRVRSKRARRRSNSLRRTEKPAVQKSTTEKKKSGFYSKVMSLFRSSKGQKKHARSGSRRVVEEQVDVEPQRKSVSVKVRETPAGTEPATEAPGLGGMTRFASGRRSACLTAEDLHQAELDREAGRS